MSTVNTSLPVNYHLKTLPDVFDVNDLSVLSYGNQTANRKRLLVIDSEVSKFYLNKIKTYFNHHKIHYHIVLLPGGEDNKNLDNLLYLLEEIEKFGISRKSEPIIGIGGGVILDILGLASTLYRRGVPYIRVPTTLLGLVDVSVAAKTGINFMGRRNRLGSYYPPIAILLDKTFLQTVPSHEISSGLGEILKMAVIKDAYLFDIIEKHSQTLLNTKFNCEYADEVIERSIEGMRVELEPNLWEKNLKRIVDFGHSFSPIIEMRSITDNSVPTLTHGEAVALGVIFSMALAYHRKLSSYKDLERVVKTAKSMGLPTYHPSFANKSILLEALNDTIKHRDGNQNLPVPNGIGNPVFINDLKIDELDSVINIFNQINEK